MRKTFKHIFLVFSLLFSAYNNLWAQGSLGTITGTITIQGGGSLAGATIHVKNESTGFTSSAASNENGGYIFNQIPLGGPYTITVSFTGYQEQIKNNYTLNQGNRLAVHFEMVQTSSELTAVTVVSNSLKSTITAAGAATTISPKEMNRLPVNGRNFTTLIDLSPLSSGASIGGQLASATNYTIDGMTARSTIAGGDVSTAYSISMEAIREFKVVNSEYDVTEGRAGGGTISTATKSGTNTFTGSAFLFGRTDWLSSRYDIRGNERDQKFSTYQYGLSMGGPIVKDKAHFFFVWDRQKDSRPLSIADIRSERDEAAFRVTQSTLDQFTNIAREKYGASENPLFGMFDKTKSTDALFGRIDWQLNAKHLLTIRNNYIYEIDNLSEGDNSGINAYESYIDRKNVSNSLIGSLRSVLGSRWTNELKLQQFIQNVNVLPSKELPDASIPRAIVENVTSGAEDQYTTSIQIGGQRFSPEWFRGKVYQLVDNIYFNTDHIKYTFGIDVAYTRMHNLYGSEMNGRFFFTGMENFENVKPYRYAREIAIVDDPSTLLHQLSSAVYGQMEFSIGAGVDLMAGMRLDNIQYLNGANYNPIVEEELGIRTDNKINTWQLQPRAQLSWDIGERGTDFLKVGGGVFGSNLNPYSMINNILFDGTKVSAVDIIDPALIPAPDFAGYRADPSTAPGKELFDNPDIEKLTTINTNSKDAKVPIVYKTNISYNHLFGNTFRLGIAAYASWARNNYMYVDRNMADAPFFTIEEEANRGVYVPANTINPQNGTANWINSRKTDRLGRVLELISDGKKNQFAIVLDGTWRYFRDGEVTASYTWNDSRDNTSYNGNVANTATLSLMVKDDPRDLSRMAYADNQFRHKVVVYATAPNIRGIIAGIRFSGIGGTRYSLAVGGNMNGDFVSSNDLAYIYDPNNPATPEYIKSGIESIMNNPDAEKGLKDYLSRSYGKMAERNGGINGFYGLFDIRLAKKFTFYKIHGIEASVDIFNVANMFNKEWGTRRDLAKQNIYTIKSFDAATERFEYNVNKPTGVSRYSGTPFQIQLGIRYGF